MLPSARLPITTTALTLAIASDRKDPVWNSRRRYTSRHDMEAVLGAELRHAENDSVRVAKPGELTNDYELSGARTAYTKYYLPREVAAMRALVALRRTSVMRGLVRDYLPIIRKRKASGFMLESAMKTFRTRLHMYRRDLRVLIRALANYREAAHG